MHLFRWKEIDVLFTVAVSRLPLRMQLMAVCYWQIITERPCVKYFEVVSNDSAWTRFSSSQGLGKECILC